MFPHMYRVRHRKSEDQNSSEEGKPEWQSDSWRRNSGKWPPTSPESPSVGDQQPPFSSSVRSPHQNKPMPVCPPSMPASSADAQADLDNRATASPIPWRLNTRSRSGSPAVQGAATPPRPSTPRTRQRREENGGLKVPEGGTGPRSRSSSPYEVWGTPEEQWAAEGAGRITPSSASASPRVRRRREPASSSSGDVFHTDRDQSQATDASEVREEAPEQSDAPPADTGDARPDTGDVGVPPAGPPESEEKVEGRETALNDHTDGDAEPSNDFETSLLENTSKNAEDFQDTRPNLSLQIPTCNGLVEHDFINDNGDEMENEYERSQSPSQGVTGSSSPEVANEWKDLLGDALGDHINDNDEENGDDFDTGKNPFYQDDINQDLFQGSGIKFIPSSKQDFIKSQQDEDEKYIMTALDEERDVLLKPFMEEEKKPVVIDSGHNKTDLLTVSENEDDARAWSPGSPIFKKDLQQHSQGRNNDEEWHAEKKQEQEDAPWWEKNRRPNDPGMVPAAPPPPGVVPPPPFKSKVDPGSTMPKMRKTNLDNIKKAVRTRPDWHTLMKDLEDGVKLRHVTERNDRSTPILPESRGKNGKFVYDSEKPMVVNELLHEIQRGVRLRRARTDDRSKPDFNKLGLKKIRRQLTVEEKKKVKPEDPEALPTSSDDDEDIDNMRDDLDATKTQLADEIKKTKKLEREKKVLKIDIEAFHAEIKKLKRQLKEAGIIDKPLMNGEDGIMPKLEKSMSKLRMSENEDLDFGELDTIESEIKELNGQIDGQRQRANGLDNKVFELEQKLKVADVNGEEWEGRSIFFEKKYKSLQRDQGIELPDISMASTQTDPSEFETEDDEEMPQPIDAFGSAARKSGSRRSFASQVNRMESFQEEFDEDESSSSSSEESEEEEDDETFADDADDDKEPDEETLAKRAANELKKLERDKAFWQTKLDHTKEKEGNVIKERSNIRERIQKHHRDMYQERVDYLKAKSELDELVNQLKDPDELEEEEQEEEEEEESHPSEEEPGWWFDKPALKPKKLKYKKRKIVNEDGEEVEEEEEEEEEDLEDLSLLEEPNWSDSEPDESDPEDENDLMQVKINFLQARNKKHEEKMSRIKKDNYLLKTEVQRCTEKYSEERLRRRRLDEELNMLLADMQ